MGVRGSYVSLDDIDDDLFGEPHRNTVEYLRERVERHADRALKIFDGFFDDARETFERYNGDRALRRIRNRVRQTADIFKGDVIRPLLTLDEIQRAKPKMQRYLMANICARIAEEGQLIDAYSDSYRNPHRGRRGWADPDYRRVIDGIIFDEDRFGVTVSDDPDEAWVAYQNLDDPTDERELDIVEKSDVLTTWSVLEIFLAAKKKDPTSVLNENM